MEQNIRSMISIIMGDYTRLDEAIMVLRGAEAERKGAAVGFRMMISPEGRAIAGLKEISSSYPAKGPFFYRRGGSLNHDRRSQDVYSCIILYLELP